MRRVKCWIENIPGSPYSQSAKHDTPFLDREGHDDYDIRTWRNKCTVNKEGQVSIPAMAEHQHFNADPDNSALMLSSMPSAGVALGLGGILQLEDAPEYADTQCEEG